MIHCAVCGAGYSNLAQCPSCGAPAPFGGPPVGAAPYGNPYGGAPHGAAPYGVNPGWQNQGKLDVSGLTIVAVIACVLCQPVGIISVIFLEQAKTAFRQGRHDEVARKISHTKTTLVVGGVIAGLMVLSYIGLIVLFAATHGRR
jgi:hypothetical protein